MNLSDVLHEKTPVFQKTSPCPAALCSFLSSVTPYILRSPCKLGFSSPPTAAKLVCMCLLSSLEIPHQRTCHPEVIIHWTASIPRYPVVANRMKAVPVTFSSFSLFYIFSYGLEVWGKVWWWLDTERASPTLLEEGCAWWLMCLLFFCAFSEGSDCSGLSKIRAKCALKSCKIKLFTM